MMPMEHVGPSVFITSRDSLGTLRDLKVKGSLEMEACCLDHQPSRLREFTTFAAYCYDSDLRRMCPIFAAVMTNERELAVYHCLEVVDRCLEEEYGASEHFDPALIIADEATAIKNAVERKLGIEKVQKQAEAELCQAQVQLWLAKVEVAFHIEAVFYLLKKLRSSSICPKS